MNAFDIAMQKENNELNSIKMSVIKALSTCGYRTKGSYSNVRNVSVDVPCSKQTFELEFVNKLKGIQYAGEDNFKCLLAPSDLNDVFGDGWNVVKYKNCHTHRRILGSILLHFRRKEFLLSALTSNNR